LFKPEDEHRKANIVPGEISPFSRYPQDFLEPSQVADVGFADAIDELKTG
jgi:hypothetical protein